MPYCHNNLEIHWLAAASASASPANFGKFLKNAWYDTDASVILSFWISSPSLASTACAQQHVSLSET